MISMISFWKANEHISTAYHMIQKMRNQISLIYIPGQQQLSGFLIPFCEAAHGQKECPNYLQNSTEIFFLIVDLI